MLVLHSILVKQGAITRGGGYWRGANVCCGIYLLPSYIFGIPLQSHTTVRSGRRITCTTKLDRSTLQVFRNVPVLYTETNIRTDTTQNILAPESRPQSTETTAVGKRACAHTSLGDLFGLINILQGLRIV